MIILLANKDIFLIFYSGVDLIYSFFVVLLHLEKSNGTVLNKSDCIGHHWLLLSFFWKAFSLSSLNMMPVVGFRCLCWYDFFLKMFYRIYPMKSFGLGVFLQKCFQLEIWLLVFMSSKKLYIHLCFQICFWISSL